MKNNLDIEIIAATGALWCSAIAGVVSSKKMLELARDVNLSSLGSFTAVVGLGSIVSYATFNGAISVLSLDVFRGERRVMFAGIGALAGVTVFTAVVSKALKDRVIFLIES